MWPDQEHGIQPVGGTTSAASGIAEEPHIVPLLDVDAYHVVFRTSQGYLGSSQSLTGSPEKPWMPSSFAQYMPADAENWPRHIHANASAVKNPRGPISPKRQSNGLVLMTCMLIHR